MNRIWLIIGIKLGYLILGGLFLRLWRGLISTSRFGIGRVLRWRYRLISIYLNFGLLTGFMWVMLKYTLSSGMLLNFSPFTSLLIDDVFNCFLLSLYFLIFLYESFLIERKTYFFYSGFGSYLRQNGYRSLLVFNVILFLRVDYSYLPLISRAHTRFSLALTEVLMAAGFSVLQLLVLFLRRLNMVEAEPELKALVRETGARMGVKIKVIRVWRLEGVTNAFATGFFRKSIFISERLLNTAAPEDLRMIIGHECAHFKRRHLLVRAGFIALLLWGASFLLDTYPDLDLGYYVLSGFGGLLIYKALSRYQELQADRLAAEKLGDGAKMAGALARVFGSGSHQKSGIIVRLFSGHPDPRLRNERLLKYDNE